MQENAEPVSKHSLDDWLARSWTGYGLAAMGVVILITGFSTVFQIFAWPGTTLMEIVRVLAVMACVALMLASLVAKFWILLTGRKIEIEPRHRYSRFLGWSIAIFMISTFVAMLVPAAMSARRAQQQATLVTHAVGDGSVVIELPASFQPNPSITVRNGFAMRDPVRDLSVMAYANHTADLAASTPQSYAKQAGLELSAEIPTGELGRMEVLTVGKTQVFRQSFAYQDAGLKFISIVDVRQFGKRIVDVRFVTRPSRLDEWTLEIDEITRSVRGASND